MSEEIKQESELTEEDITDACKGLLIIGAIYFIDKLFEEVE